MRGHETNPKRQSPELFNKGKIRYVSLACFSKIPEQSWLTFSKSRHQRQTLHMEYFNPKFKRPTKLWAADSLLQWKAQGNLKNRQPYQLTWVTANKRGRSLWNMNLQPKVFLSGKGIFISQNNSKWNSYYDWLTQGAEPKEHATGQGYANVVCTVIWLTPLSVP